MKAAALAIFQHLYASVAEQMGVTLGRTALSPNIKERLDFSCALFTGDGRLLAQAAHIPVHLGAMPASVRAAIEQCQPLAPGDAIIVNDPYLGGTHLPDVTLVSPVFAEQRATSSEQRAASHQPPATSPQPPAPSPQLPATSYQPPAPSPQPPTPSFLRRQPGSPRRHRRHDARLHAVVQRALPGRADHSAA